MTDKTPDDVFKLAKDENVEFVDVRFCDLPGIMQHFTIPLSFFDQSVFDDGLAFDGSSIRGFQSIHESDMLLLPDPETARIDLFTEARTLNLNFFVHDPFTLEPYSRDPRNIARKAENYLISTGVADTAYFGAEAEFYIFDSVSFDSRTNGSFYEVDAISGMVEHRRADRNRRQPQPRLQGPPQGRLLPGGPRRPLRRPSRPDAAQLDQVGLQPGEGPPRGRHRRPSRDQLQVQHLAARGGRHAAVQVHRQANRMAGGQDRDLHAQAAVRRQRFRHALPPVAVERRQPADVRRDGVRRAVGHRPPLHRRPAAPRAVAAGVHQPDDELLQAPGSRLRGPDQPGLQPAQPVGVRAHPDHRQQPEGQAAGVPLPRLVGQPVPGLRGHADGRAWTASRTRSSRSRQSTRTSTSCRPRRPRTSRRHPPSCPR